MDSVFVLLVIAILANSAYSVERIPGGKTGSGHTTRYWDCCKPSCGWRSYSPVQSCSKNGYSVAGVNTQSGCEDGGSAYMCNNQQPWMVNSRLAYGFAAISFSGRADNSLCCACFLLKFQGRLQGKEMIVQYTNTGGDLGTNHFDIALPGGGVGWFTRGCQSQWNAPADGWGQRYGGVGSREECDQLPKELQSGCRFRFDFLEGADNPAVDYEQVKCPSELVAVTGCS